MTNRDSGIERARESSAILAAVRHLPSAGKQSAVYRWFAAAAIRLREVVVASFLYRWLTKEPDPEVIVIDLRETWTVGPVVAALDAIVGKTSNALRGSTAGRVGRRASRAFLDAPVQAVGLATLAVAIVGLVVRAALGEITLVSGTLHVGLAAGGLLSLREDRSWDELAETRVAGLLRAILEPPEPPEDDS